MTPLTDAERRRFRDWIALHVDETLVPADEGNDDGLIYNLVQALYDRPKRFDYETAQFEEIAAWKRLAGVYVTNRWAGCVVEEHP